MTPFKSGKNSATGFVEQVGHMVEVNVTVFVQGDSNASFGVPTDSTGCR